jgi:hypothetical protein
MRFTIPMLALLSTLALGACDLAGDSTTPREQLGVELDAAKISLVEAIEIAQKQAPDAVVLEAELDVHTDVTTYDIELLDGGGEREIDVSPADGSIVRDRRRALDADDLAEAKAAAELVTASIGWAAILDKAQGAADGVAFEAEADADDRVLEVELLVDGVIWEVELGPDGSVLKSERSDDQRVGDATEAEHEDEGDDDLGGEDEVEDENDTDDEVENEDEHETDHEDETGDDDEMEDETGDDDGAGQ